MIRRLCAVVVECDRCAARWEPMQPGAVLFADESEALRAFVRDPHTDTGWRVRADGQLWCARCVAGEECALWGHAPTPWRRCRCRGACGAGRARDGGCTVEFRHCARCLRDEQRRLTRTAVREVS
ncbi:hypothetical protein GCM10012275_62440 [Longimycelium tulufanense]|uniref:Uncharacterized protein n=1 Tax=Longimycelium tulufanense TaxID=907463 RepID=A0A8J3CEJ5_9PSEU|nr:hypothetical protein [Longimycelium tulufanense]GGM83337.1 hypothetical protein GCM10012275_62440 [Longimycelium tulufanense]